MPIPALTAEGCSDRRSRLAQLFDGDLIIISNPRNLYYYTGFLPPFPSLAQWGPAYLLIGDIISGPRTLEISGGPTRRVIERGDTVILDLSPVVGGYRADYTSTIIVDAAPDRRQLGLETALQAALDEGKEKLWPGSRAADIYWAVKGSMEQHGFGDGFTHHAGHGLGLGHPEAPFFVPHSNEELVRGDVVTLEPGCYEPGCSGRIEHVFLVTENGPEQLTRHYTRFTL